jgi:nitrogen fixation/metabolism regulation signal transduction histidine kinase
VTAEDATARKMAAEAKEIAIENRAWRKEHDVRCREFVAEIRKMMDDMSDCIRKVKGEIQDVVKEANRARDKIRQDANTMWLRIAWGALGAVTTALIAIVAAIVKGWIGTG